MVKHRICMMEGLVCHLGDENIATTITRLQGIYTMFTYLFQIYSMGSFIGHAIPGSFFIMAALWWILRSLRSYYKSFSSTRTSTPFRCSVTYPPRFSRCSSLDIEAVLFFTAGALGMFVELVLASAVHHSPIGITNMQHATMYFFFGFAGLICALTPILKHSIPNIENVKYCVMLMAYVAEAILFKFHLFGRQNIDVLVHTLLLLTVYAAIISIALEMCLRDNILCVLARGISTMLQGTWFWHVGIILYRPFGGEDWEEGHHSMMLIALMFSWHIGIIMVLCIVSAIIISSYYRRKGIVMTSSFSLQNGYKKIQTDIDSETVMLE